MTSRGCSPEKQVRNKEETAKIMHTLSQHGIKICKDTSKETPSPFEIWGGEGWNSFHQSFSFTDGFLETHSLQRADQAPVVQLWRDTLIEGLPWQRNLKNPTRKGKTLLVFFSLSCLFSWPFFLPILQQLAKESLPGCGLTRGSFFFCLNVRSDVSIAPLGKHMPAAVTCIPTAWEKLGQKGSN